MRKVFSIIFSIFVAIIIVGIALFLTLYHKPETANNNTENNSQNNETVYVDNISLTCPRDLTLNVDEELHLNNDFLSVTPEQAKLNVTFEITKRGSGLVGITFEDNVIKAISKGCYYIKFSAPSSKYYTKSDTLVVNVVDEQNRVEFLNPELEVGDALNLKDIFSFSTENPNYKILVENSSIISYENDVFKILKQGTTTVHVSFIEDYGTFEYAFTLRTIQNDFKIKISEISRDTNSIKVVYQILNNGVELEFVEQEVVATIIEENMATITLNAAPLIIIKPKQLTGIIHLSITYSPKNFTEIIEINLSDYFT